MAVSQYPSKLRIPQTNPGVATVLEYLIIKFPYVYELRDHRREQIVRV
ncbi:MAG: tRNA pseudouridine32 synthase/23S rRNA pseudouridine746 synthase [Halieaceae bacterium]|jgi:tRNA pseudouridine32 synthase/23S rRNA pseudouridine746 synthase